MIWGGGWQGAGGWRDHCSCATACSGDGESETVGTDEFQTTKVTHAFTQPSEHTITLTIHTDDLQTPELIVRGNSR